MQMKPSSSSQLNNANTAPDVTSIKNPLEDLLYDSSYDLLCDRPVLIGGLHRSGTSLMRAILGSHPDLAIYQKDLPLWRQFYDRYKNKDLNIPEHQNQLIQNIVTHPKFQETEIRVDEQAILESLKIEVYVDCGKVFAHILHHYAKQVGRPRWGLKTPYNEFFADAIFASYASAKMVHMIRDPRDVAVSIKSRGWKWDIQKHCSEWRKSAQLAQINTAKYQGSYIAIRYEDLVTYPQETIQQACRYADLAYTPELLQMSGQIGWHGSNSRFSDLGWHCETISEGAVGRYIEHLPPSEIQFFRDYLEADMKQWGYC
jgi:hypothetical protein